MLDSSTERQQNQIQSELHLKDLVAVVLRHWKVVVLVPVLVAGGAYFSGRDAISQWQSGLTIQISSPKQVFARLDDIDVDELALKTDPILSEALILTTQGLALEVVKDLHLELEMSDPSLGRADYFTPLSVDDSPVRGEYELRFVGDGTVQLRDSSGALIAEGPIEQPLEGPGFTLQPVPDPTFQGSVRFRVVSPEFAASWVSAGLSYTVREGTNAVDIFFTATDRTLVPHILNQAANQLRLDGARRARQIARIKREYIAEQVDRANEQFEAKLKELQGYKERQQITDLTAEEGAVVQAIQNLEQQRQQVLVQMATFRSAMAPPDSIGIETLNRLAAVEGISDNTALSFQIQNLLQLYDERRKLTAGALGLKDDNPQVDAVNQRIGRANTALHNAVGAALESLNDRLDALQDKIDEQRATLRAFPGKETRIAQLRLEEDILNQTLQYLLGQYESARMQEATIAPYITILDGASPPFQIGTSLKQKIVLGFLVGLLIGFGGAFFLEYLDQTIKSATDIERLLRIPVLGMIPSKISAAVSGNGRRLGLITIDQLEPDEPITEAYRGLRTNVTFVGAEKPIQFVAVTSPGPGEGKSTTATNLALTLSLSGHRTILIDGDLRRPQTHRAFGIVQDPGLTDVLVGAVDPREAIRPGVSERLDLLPAGSTPPNPSELLGSERMGSLISELRQQYDYIIIDTPPVLPVTDAVVVASGADATILVVRSGDTEERTAQRALEQLERVGARIAGAVLNGITSKRESYYSYYNYRSSRGSRSPNRSLRSRIAQLF